MHLGMICPEMTGHLNPMTTLGRELDRRGHQVSFLVGPRAYERVARAGLDVVPCGEAADAELAAAAVRLGELSGIAAMRFCGRMLRRMTEVTFSDAPRAIREARIDALVVDQISPAGAVVAEQLGVPYVVACNALACHIDPSVPPPPLAWKYRAGWLGRLRNRFGNFFAQAV